MNSTVRTSQSDTGALLSVVIKHASDAFNNQESIDKQFKDLNYIDRPNYSKAIDEYQAFEELLRQYVPTVHKQDHNSMGGMDSMYCRDASIITDDGVIMLNMGKELRKPESQQQADFLDKLDIPVFGKITGAATMEGGDVAWLDTNVLAVGHGYRTNQEGFDQLSDMLNATDIECVQVDLPHYKGASDVFHLMSIFSPVGLRKAVVYSPLMSVKFRNFLLSMDYELIEVPDDEFDTLGCNVLSLDHQTCMMVEGNPVTQKRIQSVGIEVVCFKGDEICIKGGGGPTCLTRPLLRQL